MVFQDLLKVSDGKTAYYCAGRQCNCIFVRTKRSFQAQVSENIRGCKNILDQFPIRPVVAGDLYLPREQETKLVIGAFAIAEYVSPGIGLQFQQRTHRPDLCTVELTKERMLL